MNQLSTPAEGGVSWFSDKPSRTLDRVSATTLGVALDVRDAEIKLLESVQPSNLYGTRLCHRVQVLDAGVVSEYYGTLTVKIGVGVHSCTTGETACSGTLGYTR